MKIIRNYLKQGGIIFLLLCVVLALNNRFGYITLVGFFSILVLVVTLRSKIDKGAAIVLLYLVSYILFSYMNGVYYSLSTLVLYAIAPFFFYQYGKQLPCRYMKENELKVAWLIVIVCYGIDIYWTTISNIISTRELILASRIFSFTDDNTMVKSATLIGLPMGIGMIGLPMFIIEKNKTLKVLFISLFIISMVVTFSLINRTGIFVASLCFFIVIGYRYRKRTLLLILILLLMVMMVFVLIETNIISSELISLYNERNADLSSMGSRSYRWNDAVIKLLSHPTGWYNGEVYYVHNMWLDVARMSGLLPFILLVYISYDSFIKSFRLVKRFNNSLSYMMLGLNVCFFATCFVEPIYGGTHFMLYCMLWGTENELTRIKYKY